MAGLVGEDARAGALSSVGERPRGVAGDNQGFGEDENGCVGHRGGAITGVDQTGKAAMES